MNLDKYEKYSPFVLRLGVAFVFLWFGISQLSDPTQWARMIPTYATTITHLSANTIVHLNGVFEIVFAILLIIGIYTRFVSFILGLHLIHISTILGYGPTAMRDIALAIVTFSIFLRGADEFCLDSKRKKKEVR